MHYLNNTLTMLASYGNKTLAQLTTFSINYSLYFLNKKEFRIINFKEGNDHSFPLFNYSKIIEIADKVKIENCLFINRYANNKLPSIFY